MVPLFPVIFLLGLALALVVIVILTITITLGCLWIILKEYKTSGFSGAVWFWIGAEAMMVGQLWHASRDKTSDYFLIVKALFSNKQKLANKKY